MRVEMKPDIVRDYLNQIDAYREWQRR